MNSYILDANVLMSMLISGRATYKQMLQQAHFFTPDFALLELNEHKSAIMSKTRLTPDELGAYSRDLFRHITVLLRMTLAEEISEQAEILCEKVDPNDVSYVAFSLQLGFPLITRDKPLFTGLRKKGFREVMLFESFLQAI